MKNPLDPRHLFRQKIIQVLFENSFKETIPLKTGRFPGKFKSIINDIKVKGKVKKIIQNYQKIDHLIQDAAPEWPIDKIAKVDLAILRLAIYELTVSKDIPIKVAIDEAVELAKEFGGETSSKFVNGALGKVTKNLSVVGEK